MESILGSADRSSKHIDGLEKYINKVSGVLSSKIVTDETGKIIEVHVLSDISRSPKQIVRDIQSCAAAVFDIQLEYKTISVAQIDHNISKNSNRLKLNDFNVIGDGQKLTVKTYLSSGERIYEGTATGMSSSRGRYMTAASACIDAIHSYLGSQYVFNVADVQRMPIAGMDSFCVAIGFLQNDAQGMLLGSSLQKGDEYCSIMKATLDAVNRMLVNMLKEKNNPDDDLMQK